MLVFGLMLLLQTAACLDQFCWLNQSDACYAALGHKLSLLMVLNASEYEMTIQKRINNNKTTDPACRVKNGKMKDCDLYSNRPETTVINRTLIINHVIRADSGNYTVTISNPSDGQQTFQGELQVNVEAPIGSVQVSIMCSSSGVMRASCSSKGDQLLYSWTLNGDPLMSGNSSIDLDEGTEGNTTCTVKNHINNGQTTISVNPCSVLNVSLIVLACIALILILLFITVCHIYKKKQVKLTTAAAGNMEIIYADISHEKTSEKRKTETLTAADVEYTTIKPQKKEEEVQYGEVTFTQNRSNAHQRPQDCVYSEVHRY
ncbi:hypothetical protein Q8A67_013381 [Cirrhinus molitorella]|uniref:Ig-like domain-containing protein n=1 Tax=Cirrhinus molitorella TaxID=172907 RepID=A0AA88PLN3_9TELE|nr:hypothetical protein Q8A67_013381 [Cirrhinus molitorella]